jgi:hypothetical protein
MIFAFQTSGGFTSSLDGRQKQCDQNADDRNDHQQFHQRKTHGMENAAAILAIPPGEPPGFGLSGKSFRKTADFAIAVSATETCHELFLRVSR